MKAIKFSQEIAIKGFNENFIEFLLAFFISLSNLIREKLNVSGFLDNVDFWITGLYMIFQPNIIRTGVSLRTLIAKGIMVNWKSNVMILYSQQLSYMYKYNIGL